MGHVIDREGNRPPVPQPGQLAPPLDAALTATRRRRERRHAARAAHHVGWIEYEAIDADEDVGLVHAEIYRYPRELNAQLGQLGVPADADAFTFLEACKDWSKRAAFEFETTAYGVDVTPQTWKWRQIGDNPYGLPPFLAVALQHAWKLGTVGYGAAAWPAEGPPSFSYEGISPEWDLEDLRGAREALRFVNHIRVHAGGAPPRYEDADEPRFFEDLGKTVHRVIRNGERVTWASLARHWPADKRTIQKDVRRFGYDVGALAAEAARCTQKLSLCTVHVRRRGEYKKKRE